MGNGHTVSFTLRVHYDGNQASVRTYLWDVNKHPKDRDNRPLTWKEFHVN